MSLKITEISAQETYNLRHQVMWPNKPQSYIQLKEDNEGIHFGLWKDSNIISVVSLFIKNDSAQFRKFATKASEQGYGYGTLLLEHLIAFVSSKLPRGKTTRHSFEKHFDFEASLGAFKSRLSSKKLNKLWCNARADKTLFYERFGMVKTSKTYTKDGIDFVIMEKCFIASK